MTLTTRQRTKVNAALCLIHDNGHDAKPVIKLANELAKEVDTRTAYELALNEFLANVPTLAPIISKIIKLVDASDDGTVDQYDAALSQYVTTGDDSTLNSLAPMIAEDSLALAVRDGEITQDEADSGDLSKALGFEPGPAMVEAIAARADQSEEGPPEPSQPAWQPKAQADRPQLGEAASGRQPEFVNGSQVGAAIAPTGMVAAGAARNWVRNTGQPLPNGAMEAPEI
jgi:hypothetical protein